MQLLSSRGFISAAGEAITSGVIDEINLQFQYGIPELDVKTTLVTTGNAFAQNGFAMISTGTHSNGGATIQSIQNVRYRAGHESYAFFTASFTMPSAIHSKQLIGLFDDNDGVAVGLNGGLGFSILFRKAGNTDLYIPQSKFNLDPLNGNGPSGFTLNPACLNLFRISYGWLGASPIKFQILNSDGVWITFHLIERPNSGVDISFKNPTFPIRAQVFNNGNTSDIVLKTLSWNAGIVGGPSTSASRFFSKSNFITILDPNTETHVITFQNQPTFQSVINKVAAHVTAIGGGGNDFSNNPILIRLYKNALVTGTNFTNVNSADSVMLFSTDGTFVPTGLSESFLFISNSFGGGPQNLFIPQENLNIVFQPGETITLTAESLGSSGIPTIGTMTWEELF